MSVNCYPTGGSCKTGPSISIPRKTTGKWYGADKIEEVRNINNTSSKTPLIGLCCSCKKCKYQFTKIIEKKEKKKYINDLREKECPNCKIKVKVKEAKLVYNAVVKRLVVMTPNTKIPDKIKWINRY